MIIAFLSGLITMGLLVATGYFVRFWNRTGDALFAAFALAFMLLALSQALTTVLNAPLEETTWVFLMRLGAFTILVVAILRKNVSKRD